MVSARHRWVLILAVSLSARPLHAQRDTVPADSIAPTAPVATLSELLTGRVPNALILSYDGTPGAGPAVVLRGLGGPSAFSGPLLVIDGVRAVGATSKDNPIDVGHPGTSRLDDIDPMEIERIEVLPGPAAAARFGPDAGNGAILVTLRHAGATPATGELSVEEGRVKNALDWASNYYAWGHTPTGTVRQCQTYQHATGQCVVDSVTHVNLLTGPNAPFRTAYEQRYTGDLAAGGRGLRVSLGGVYDYEPGTLILQPSQATTFQKQFGTAPSDAQRYPSSFNRGNLRGAVGADLGSKADLGVSVAYTGSNQRSADVNGLLLDATEGQGYLGSTQGWSGPVQAPWYDFFDTPTQRDVRLTSNVQGHWRPAAPLALHVTLGSDAVDQRSADVENFPASGAFGPELATATDREKRTQYTADVGGTISAGSASAAFSAFSFGGQYLETHLDDRSRMTTSSGPLFSQQFSQFMAPVRTQSAYADEALTISQHVTIDGGVRWDHQRLHADRTKATSLNPSVSGTWVLAGSVADPKLRLRGAFGQTTTLTDPQVLLESSRALNFNAFRARPERDRELEGGFDAALPGAGNWTLGGTIYARRNINAPVPAAVQNQGGPQFVTTYYPGGTISNRGVEMTLSGRLVDKPDLEWDATLLASENYNKLLRDKFSPAIYSNGLRVQTGYPVFGVWGGRYTFADSNNDGVIESTEITPAQNASYIGPSAPTHLAALSSTMRLIKGHVRLSTVFDYRGGYVLPDVPAYYRALLGTDRATNGSGASLANQARDLAVSQAAGVPTGFEQRVSAVRWRELAATFGPTTGRRFDLTIAARNLALWSGYRGGDPDQDNGIAPAMHLPQPLTWLLRVTAGF